VILYCIEMWMHPLSCMNRTAAAHRHIPLTSGVKTRTHMSPAASWFSCSMSRYSNGMQRAPSITKKSESPLTIAYAPGRLCKSDTNSSSASLSKVMHSTPAKVCFSVFVSSCCNSWLKAMDNYYLGSLILMHTVTEKQYNCRHLDCVEN
jgi:hypothetical protein